MQTILIDDSLIQAICQVTGTNNEQKIIEITLREWESLQETLYVLQNPSLMQQINRSMQTWQAGQGYIPSQAELDALN